MQSDMVFNHNFSNWKTIEKNKNIFNYYDWTGLIYAR